MSVSKGVLAPEFELSNQFGATVRLSDFRGQKPVALVFFPLAFSGVCTGELCELRDNLSLFADRGIELIGISVDSKWALRAWGEQEGYEFALLADFWPHGAVAREYGVFLDDRGVANRATFLVDRNGIVRDAFVTAPGQARDLERYRAAVATVASESPGA